ncbi:MAG: hypothetical protein KatS3mg018_1401 [Fimbriimonadales bacterium]|nr:MAG: hypothetical protein KatS3mg018_1401 [Fimbriimonadales bacterium]
MKTPIHTQEQPDGANPITHPVYHLQQLLQQLPTRTQRPAPNQTLRQLLYAELLAPTHKTIAQLERTHQPHRTHPRPAAYRLFQRYFQPDDAFHTLRLHTLQHCPPEQPYCVIADGTTVPRTGKSIPGAFWRQNPQNAPFARGLRWAQSFVMLGALVPPDDGNARCVPIEWLPAFSQRCARAQEGSRRSEIAGWIEGVRRVRATLDAAGRTQQLLVCVGDGRGDTKAWGTLLLPNTVCCARARRDSLWCDLPEAHTGRGRRRVYGARWWRPCEVWQGRTGWQMVQIHARGRAIRVPVRVLGPCRRKDWGAPVFFVILVRGRRKRRKREKTRAPQAFWVQAVGDGQGGWQLPLALERLVGLLWQRWEIEVCFRSLKSGFGLGEKPCWGLVSGERSVSWSAWVYGVLVLSGYRAWGWLRAGGERRWTLREVLRDVRWGVLLENWASGGCACGAGKGAKNGLCGCWWCREGLWIWLGAFRW